MSDESWLANDKGTNLDKRERERGFDGNHREGIFTTKETLFENDVSNRAIFAK